MDTTSRAWQALRLAVLCCGCADVAFAEESVVRRAEPALRVTEPARFTELQPDSRFAFELDGNGDAARLRGAFRIQLNDSSSLALRPRGGGLVIAFRSRF